MKKTIVVTALMLSGFILQPATAQVRVNVQSNISEQPIWGPVGYNRADYYYMPDIDAFYQVSSRQYIYQERGNWVFVKTLPPQYHEYDVYNGYKVVINEPTPYRQVETYRVKYATYKGKHGQEIIRNSHDKRYFKIKGHPEHSKWKSSHKKHKG